MLGAWNAYSEILNDKLKPEWPAKRVSCSSRYLSDRQIPLGRVVWTTLSGQLEKVLDVSTVSSIVRTLWLSTAFTIGYYFLHNWVWRQILWLTFGSAK
jgi:hypothetical protein